MAEKFQVLTPPTSRGWNTCRSSTGITGLACGSWAACRSCGTSTRKRRPDGPDVPVRGRHASAHPAVSLDGLAMIADAPGGGRSGPGNAPAHHRGLTSQPSLASGCGQPHRTQPHQRSLRWGYVGPAWVTEGCEVEPGSGKEGQKQGRHSTPLPRSRARTRLAAPFPAARAAGNVSRARIRPAPGATAIPWLGCGELSAGLRARESIAAPRRVRLRSLRRPRTRRGSCAWDPRHAGSAIPIVLAWRGCP